MANSQFKMYRKSGLTPMRPYVEGEDMTGITIAKEDSPPQYGGMIARDLLDHNDQWYISRRFFFRNYEEV